MIMSRKRRNREFEEFCEILDEEEERMAELEEDDMNAKASFAWGDEEDLNYWYTTLDDAETCDEDDWD